ncbi:hypothetical protein [Caballeronia sp. KNU42]
MIQWARKASAGGTFAATDVASRHGSFVVARSAPFHVAALTRSTFVAQFTGSS